jgi:1-acyl-sn-glycerol-3-phosphate acyltransferase
MFVLNHVSWLDIFLLDAVLPVTFVAKSEIGAWPLVGTLVTRAGTLYIERGSKSAARRTSERVAEALRNERPIAIFPEGTTSHGESVQRFHAALFQPAVDTSSTIIPVALRSSDAQGRLTHAASYVGDDSLIKSIWMIVSERRMSARLEFLAPIAAQGGERRALAERCHADIAAALASFGSSAGEHG